MADLDSGHAEIVQMVDLLANRMIAKLDARAGDPDKRGRLETLSAQYLDTRLRSEAAELRIAVSSAEGQIKTLGWSDMDATYTARLSVAQGLISAVLDEAADTANFALFQYVRLVRLLLAAERRKTAGSTAPVAVA